jgi:hypothetical protein
MRLAVALALVTRLLQSAYKQRRGVRIDREERERLGTAGGLGQPDQAMVTIGSRNTSWTA